MTENLSGGKNRRKKKKGGGREVGMRAHESTREGGGKTYTNTNKIKYNQ